MSKLLGSDEGFREGRRVFYFDGRRAMHDWPRMIRWLTGQRCHSWARGSLHSSFLGAGSMAGASIRTPSAAILRGAQIWAALLVAWRVWLCSDWHLWSFLDLLVPGAYIIMDSGLCSGGRLRSAAGYEGPLCAVCAGVAAAAAVVAAVAVAAVYCWRKRVGYRPQTRRKTVPQHAPQALHACLHARSFGSPGEQAADVAGTPGVPRWHCEDMPAEDIRIFGGISCFSGPAASVGCPGCRAAPILPALERAARSMLGVRPVPGQEGH